GGEPVLSEVGAASRRAGWDEIAAARPEVVVFMPCGYDLSEAKAEAESSRLAEHPALAGCELVAVDATAYFSRPGPRLVAGVALLAWAIQPDQFPTPAAAARRAFRIA